MTSKWSSNKSVKHLFYFVKVAIFQFKYLLYTFLLVFWKWFLTNLQNKSILRDNTDKWMRLMRSKTMRNSKTILRFSENQKRILLKYDSERLTKTMWVNEAHITALFVSLMVRFHLSSTRTYHTNLYSTYQCYLWWVHPHIQWTSKKQTKKLK